MRRKNFSRLSFSGNLLISVVGTALTLAAAHATVKDLPALGDQPAAVDVNGNLTSLYKASYALFISNGNYVNGWPKLDHADAQLDLLATVLEKQGFAVRRISDADHNQLRSALREFVFGMAKEPDSRAIVFYSGHGFTNKAGLGYLVPTDAPDPDKDPSVFFERAMPINELQLLAAEASSRHMLFIFDSCFSGSIFATKGPETRPDPATEDPSTRQPYFLGAAQQPVRQFLAAGGPKERVPAESVFIPLLTKALSGNAAIKSDGYLTGKELGLWLEQTLPAMTGDMNHPHSDVLQNPTYAFGDMVFWPRRNLSPANVTSPKTFSLAARPLSEAAADLAATHATNPPPVAASNVADLSSTACVSSESVGVRSNNERPLSYEGNLLVCYAPSKITIKVLSLRVKNNTSNMMYVDNVFLALTIRESRKGKYEYGDSLFALHDVSVIPNSPIPLAARGVLEVPRVADFEFGFEDWATLQGRKPSHYPKDIIRPGTKVVARIGVNSGEVDGKNSFVHTDYFKRLAAGDSGF